MMKLFFFLLLLAAMSTLHGQATTVPRQGPEAPGWADPPRLVVGIVIDQMRTDLLYRYWNNFGDDGFRRLVNEGAFLRDAHFDYSPTYTGPGHASIYTGTTPAHHGIVGNDMFLRATGGGLYCAGDPEMQGVGCEGPAGERSPVNLLSSTMADELERRTARRSRTIGLALKDRGAILPIGRTGDAAYWFAGGVFASSNWYFDALPQWVVDFNAEDRNTAYMQNTWDLVLPRERYLQVLPDDNPYEIPLPGAEAPTLPQDLSALYKPGSNLITTTPWGNTITTDFAIAALVGEEMGLDEYTDLLAISYSSPDILGHRMGLRSLELEDMYIRLDRDIARLLNELDARVGRDRYTLFLTADHAAADVPEYIRDLRGSSGYVDHKDLRTKLDSMLVRRHGRGDWILSITNEQVFLNDRLIQEKKLDMAQVQRQVAEALLAESYISHAITATELTNTVYPEGVQRSIQRGFMPQRSGDVCFAMFPGMIDVDDVPAVGKGTTHGSVWNYDTHVPVIFFGKGVTPGEVVRRTSITDIAPTIAMIVGMTMPDASTGHAVPEVLGH
jgi:predicted AlkP superfamily pyrophosphatase or phosphodiesterase